MRKLVCVAIIAGFCLPRPALNQQQPPAVNSGADTLIFRDPFTLRLRVDKDHYYEEHYDKRIPYVAEEDIYLFSGENFGVHLAVKDDDVVEVTYEPDVKKADVSFSFRQAKELPGGVGMMLIVQNKMKRRLYMDALMTVPGKKEILKTSIVPIDGGLSDYEEWPHPIVQLVVRNVRFTEKAASKPK